MKCYAATALFAFAYLLSTDAKRSERSLVVTPEEHYSKLNDGQRIVGGAPAEVGQLPWQVAVFWTSEDEQGLCGGSLIAPQWVLTAGHCVDLAVSAVIYLGGVTINATEEGRVTATSSRFIVHPEFDFIYLYNDVGLVYLDSPVNYTERVQPVALAPSSINVGGNVSVTVSGWGRVSTNSGRSNVLNFVELTTITNTQCEDYYFYFVLNSTLCAVGNPYHSPCIGDSGGALVVYEDGEPVQVGIVSFVSGLGCESGYPSGYARVSSFSDWIYETIGL